MRRCAVCCEACHWPLTSDLLHWGPTTRSTRQSSCTSALVSLLFGWFLFLFLGIYCVDILKHNCGFNHVNVLFLTTMFVKCNQSLFLLHGHRRTNNFTFLFIFGCFFCFVFCLFIASARCCAFVSRLLRCFSFLWSFLFAAFFLKSLAGVETDSFSNETITIVAVLTLLPQLER